MDLDRTCRLCDGKITPDQQMVDGRGRLFHRSCFDAALKQLEEMRAHGSKIVGQCSNPQCRQRYAPNKLPPADRQVACPKCGAVVRFTMVPTTPPDPPQVDSQWLDEALEEMQGADQHAENRRRLKLLLRSTNRGTTFNTTQRAEAVRLIAACLAAMPDRCPACDERMREKSPQRCYACNLQFASADQVDEKKRSMRQVFTATKSEMEERERRRLAEARQSSQSPSGRIAGEIAGRVLFEMLFG